MSNTIVAEIHSSFATAEEELLQEAQSILKGAEDEDKKERATALSRMGFGNAKPVRLLSKEEQARAEELLFMKSRYERIAPQYKFITEEKLMSICEKYGLVLGSSERYTQDIPDANQTDIMNFKILDQSFLEISDDSYLNAKHKTKDGEVMHPKDMATSHIYNTLNVFKRGLMRDQFGHYMSSDRVEEQHAVLIRSMITELHLRGEHDMLKEMHTRWKNDTPLSGQVVNVLFTPIKTTYFYVAADIDSFDTKDTELQGNKLVETDWASDIEESMKQDLFRHYDPIVLAKVQGGYLIVTAWGDEASDPDVINPVRN